MTKSKDPAKSTTWNQTLELLNHTRKCGVDRKTLHALLLLKEETYKIKDIARIFKVSPAALTGTADRLEAAKICKREKDPEDRRGYYLSITELGEKVLDHLLNGKPVTITFSKGRRPTATVEFPEEATET